MPETLQTLPSHLETDCLAKDIADRWLKWNTARVSWLDEKKELREYLFATDTRKTTNSKLPWKNSTVTPKLTQIRDNLHANYIAALFPNDNWFVWEAADKDEAAAKKRSAIENYMRAKLKESKFELAVSGLIYDYIDYGNVIAGHEYVNLSKTDPDTGESIQVYRGPRAFRVSPLDVVFDPTADTFARSPLIRRVLKNIGDLQRDIQTKPNLGYDPAVVSKAMEMRSGLRDYADVLKNAGFEVDGFGSIEEYFNSDMVELLEFWGDIYDKEKKEVLLDQVITVIDRRWILRKQTNKSWLGERPFFHCGWRLRPDNLWAQGPLDQLIGMQYRIDHLENLRADVFDQIAHPITKITGHTVEAFEFGPGVQIFCGDEGDVAFERPDATALQADMQIADLMNKMEELAGAPKQAMGIRTPGEKTKYEVQVLENGAGRIFQAKVSWFEKNIIEPLLNSMLEEARRNLAGAEKVRVVDPELGIEEFISIRPEDIKGRGKLYPVGARHFAEEAKFVQDLASTVQVVQQSPMLSPHFSGKRLAKALEEKLGWTKYKIVQDNIGIAEQLETQRLVQSGTEALQTEAGIPSEVQPSDMMDAPPDESAPSEAQAEGF